MAMGGDLRIACSFKFVDLRRAVERGEGGAFG